jgi:hypothetical protein
MLDDLRNSSSFIDDEDTNEHENDVIERRPMRQRNKETFLGMTAQQRFIISLMLFFMVCLLGWAALIFTRSVVIPGM